MVAVLFVVLFLALCLWLPGFGRLDNLMTLLRNVSVLGMLGVAMALVGIGRGIDLSLVSLMVVPPGLALQLIHDGWGTGPAFAPAIGLMLAFALFNGWLVAYAEISVLFATPHDFAQAVHAAIPDAPIQIEPGTDYHGLGVHYHGVMDNRRALEDLGFTPRYDLMQGVAHCVRALRART